MKKILLGVSSCLLGENVRWNGGHKRDRYLTDVLGRFVEWVPVCPECEVGLGVPRETLRLVGDPENPRLVTTRSNIDHTESMKAWAARRLDRLEKLDLCGYIFKSGSPSSGMTRVKVYGDKGQPARKGSGIFARAFMNRFPCLPVEDEGRLQDADIRENFIERVFTLRRWRDALSDRGRGATAAVVDFQTHNKLLLMAHSPKKAKELGALAAKGKSLAPDELCARYEETLLACLRLHATVKKNCNVLEHVLGYFKKDIGADEKRELLDIIGNYRGGLVPLIVPVTLFRHFVRKYGKDYLSGQTYLNPHPAALRLRNHV